VREVLPAAHPQRRHALRQDSAAWARSFSGLGPFAPLAAARVAHPGWPADAFQPGPQAGLDPRECIAAAPCQLGSRPKPRGRLSRPPWKPQVRTENRQLRRQAACCGKPKASGANGRERRERTQPKKGPDPNPTTADELGAPEASASLWPPLRSTRTPPGARRPWTPNLVRSASRPDLPGNCGQRTKPGASTRSPYRGAPTASAGSCAEGRPHVPPARCCPRSAASVP
jgi:hypothetical protein